MNNVINLSNQNLKFDPWLLASFLGLLAFSIVMVGSASIPFVEKYQVVDYYFIGHHLNYLLISLISGFIVTFIPIKYIEKGSILCGLLGLILLFLVFVPGIARMANGAYRWIGLRFFSIQPSELSKLLLTIYVAGYLVRKKELLRGNLSAFIPPLVILGAFDVLLLLEPDFGAMFILSCTIISLLFVGGIKLRYLVMLILLGSLIVMVLLVTSNYRMQRIIGFLNPWDDRYNKGYQLVQSLIAFGRGGWFGLGLGNSVQKLLYLPEAYTDFIFAIIAEELGLLGASVTIVLLTILVARCFNIAQTAILAKKKFAGYLAYGVGFWLGLQSVVNIGVNIGLLPTKGLTLPFMSYGGNSLLVCCLSMGIVFRVDYEIRKIACLPKQE